MSRKVGLLVGREWSFPPAFIEEVNNRDAGVTVEYVKLGGTAMDEPKQYDVIVDRISHEVPYYRTYLKHAVLEGTHVVNNPFMWTADDKFFGATLATKLGIAHPRTVVLPNRDYVPGIVHDESLRNLQYPLDWESIVNYVGMPCILKDAHGGGWKDVYVCKSLDQLLHHYATSGLLTMIVQEFIEWDHFIRCICLGQEDILPIKYDPKERKYHVVHEHMTPELGKRVIDDSLKLVRALGYDMNSMEWAVKDGVPYAIDFMNPAPDMDINSLTPHYFEWVVKKMADMVIRMASDPRPQVRELRWSELFAGSRAEQNPASAQTASNEQATSQQANPPAEAQQSDAAARARRLAPVIDSSEGGMQPPKSARATKKAAERDKKARKADAAPKASGGGSAQKGSGKATGSTEGQGKGRGKGAGRPKNPGHRS